MACRKFCYPFVYLQAATPEQPFSSLLQLSFLFSRRASCTRRSVQIASTSHLYRESWGARARMVRASLTLRGTSSLHQKSTKRKNGQSGRGGGGGRPVTNVAPARGYEKWLAINFAVKLLRLPNARICSPRARTHARLACKGVPRKR